MNSPTEPKSLVETCLDTVSKNFTKKIADTNKLSVLSIKLQNEIYSRIPIPSDVLITGPIVHRDDFWRRMCNHRWENCQIQKHAMSWKQTFFELHISDLMENFGKTANDQSSEEGEFLREPIDSEDMKWLIIYPRLRGVHEERCCRNGEECCAPDLLRMDASMWPALERIKTVLVMQSLIGRFTLREYIPPQLLQKYQETGEWPEERNECLVCSYVKEFRRLVQEFECARDYIFSLELQQLMSHLDLNWALNFFPNLNSLKISYGVKKIGTKYDRMLFGMKLQDARSLSLYLGRTNSLVQLSLPANLLDDELLKELADGLRVNDTLVELDLSHNNLTSTGVAMLADVLRTDSPLMSLDLTDNLIHTEGGRHLGRALHENHSLLYLGLRLNRLQDEGGRMLIEGLAANQTLESINVSGNSLGTKAVAALGFTLPSSHLVQLDLSCNDIADDDMITLSNAVHSSKFPIVSLDLRMNKFSKENEDYQEILELVSKNKQKK